MSSTVTVTGTASSDWLKVVEGQSIEVSNDNWNSQTVAVQKRVGSSAIVHAVQKDGAAWTPGADDYAIADGDFEIRLNATSLTGTATLRRGLAPEK